MMKLLDTDGAWLAIGISVFFILVGVVMKRVFVKVLKNSESVQPSIDKSTDQLSDKSSVGAHHD